MKYELSLLHSSFGVFDCSVQILGLRPGGWKGIFFTLYYENGLFLWADDLAPIFTP